MGTNELRTAAVSNSKTYLSGKSMNLQGLCVIWSAIALTLTQLSQVRCKIKFSSNGYFQCFYKGLESVLLANGILLYLDLC